MGNKRLCPSRSQPDGPWVQNFSVAELTSAPVPRGEDLASSWMACWEHNKIKVGLTELRGCLNGPRVLLAVFSNQDLIPSVKGNEVRLCFCSPLGLLTWQSKSIPMPALAVCPSQSPSHMCSVPGKHSGLPEFPMILNKSFILLLFVFITGCHIFQAGFELTV